MRIGALVLGVIGGLVALLYGFLGFGLGSIADAGIEGSGTLMKLVSIGVPVGALVGAGIVVGRPTVGAALMGVAAVALVVLLGFNFFSLVPVVLLGIGSLLGFLDGGGSTRENEVAG